MMNVTMRMATIYILLWYRNIKLAGGQRDIFHGEKLEEKVLLSSLKIRHENWWWWQLQCPLSYSHDIGWPGPFPPTTSFITLSLIFLYTILCQAHLSTRKKIGWTRYVKQILISKYIYVFSSKSQREVDRKKGAMVRIGFSSSSLNSD